MASAPAGGNVFAAVPDRLADEQVLELLATPGLRIERIVSTGQASPPGFWYDQDRDEWVLLLAGAAAVAFATEPEPRQLLQGSYLHIPAHVRHRVEWTSTSPPAVWLAVHWPPAR
jgi:cupin 2 domain-containing protein